MKASRDTIKEVYNDRVLGGLVGFVVGDALGLPISGMKSSDAKKGVGYIEGYVRNFRHPFFYFLKKGQYGSNARLVIKTTKSLVVHKGYDHQDLKNRLILITKKSKEDFFYSRWLGKTLTAAVLRGKPSNSLSCSCIYRSIPIALFYDDLGKAIFLSEKQSKITHISPTSLASSFFITYLLFYLKYGKEQIEDIVEEALKKIINKYKGSEFLTNKIEMILCKKIKSIEEARKVFGTGSHADQVVSLSLFIFMRHRKNFKRAVLLGANSSREDNEDAQKSLLSKTYMEELIDCVGGATDLIAGLTGCFIGSHIGYTHIPSEFLKKLEDRELLIKLVNQRFV